MRKFDKLLPSERPGELLRALRNVVGCIIVGAEELIKESRLVFRRPAHSAEA